MKGVVLSGLPATGIPLQGPPTPMKSPGLSSRTWRAYRRETGRVNNPRRGWSTLSMAPRGLLPEVRSGLASPRLAGKAAQPCGFEEPDQSKPEADPQKLYPLHSAQPGSKADLAEVVDRQEA